MVIIIMVRLIEEIYNKESEEFKALNAEELAS